MYEVVVLRHSSSSTNDGLNDASVMNSIDRFVTVRDSFYLRSRERGRRRRRRLRFFLCSQSLARFGLVRESRVRVVEVVVVVGLWNEARNTPHQNGEKETTRSCHTAAWCVKEIEYSTLAGTRDQLCRNNNSVVVIKITEWKQNKPLLPRQNCTTQYRIAVVVAIVRTDYNFRDIAEGGFVWSEAVCGVACQSHSLDVVPTADIL